MSTTTINTHYGKNIKWTVYRNGYNAFVGTLTLNGSAYDISSRVFTAYIRTPQGSENKLTLTEGNGITNGGATGLLTIALTEAQLATLPRDRYFMVVEYTISSKDYPLIQGFIETSSETNPGTTTTSATIPVSIDGTTVSMAVTLGGGGGGTWGSITGTLASQTDLQAALDAKADSDEVDADLSQIAALSPSNDDIIQRKSGQWTNRTIAQLLSDLGLSEITTDIAYFSAVGGTDLTFTNQANTEQAINTSAPGRSTRRFDSTNFNYMKLVVHVRTGSTSVNNPRLYVHSSTDDVTYALVGSGLSGEIVSMTNTGFQETDWISLSAGQKGNYYWRIMMHGGDGAADPAVGSIHLRFKR